MCMLKRYLLALVFLVPLQVAAQLPDFTDLVEKEGAAVVNISTTQTARNPVAGRGAIPNLPDDDPFYDFFRRFMPNPQQGPQGQTPREFQSQALGSGLSISADRH